LQCEEERQNAQAGGNAAPSSAEEAFLHSLHKLDEVSPVYGKGGLAPLPPTNFGLEIIYLESHSNLTFAVIASDSEAISIFSKPQKVCYLGEFG
jgi:hypothetical protein